MKEFWPSMARFQAHDKLIVVKHRPGAGRQRRLFFVMSMLITAVLAYGLGYSISGAQRAQAVSSLESLSVEHEQLKINAQSLQQAVANLESGREIDDLAKNQIQNTIGELRESVSSLEKDVSFYKNIMAPSDNAKGLQVQSSEIKATADAQRFAYKIVLAQVADNKSYVSGVVAVNLIGSKDGDQEIVALRDISDQEELGIKFKFRYFQNIEGDLVLPEGFEPSALQVVAQSKGKKASRIEQSYDWSNVLVKND
jgi:hypothetical protein